MANVIIPPEWRTPDREATPESVYLNRRAFLKSSGLGMAALGLGACGSEFTPSELVDETPEVPVAQAGCDDFVMLHPLQSICPSPTANLYPAVRNSTFDVPGPDQTDRVQAAVYNNFYEFIGSVDNRNSVWPYVGPFKVWPWSVEVVGEAEGVGVYDISDFEREFGLEERLYRHRCVERWSMVVPWTGYPLAKLIDKLMPLSSAEYVRFVTFDRPDEAVGQRIQPSFPWPYFEGLRLDEARNELAFVVTGVFGEPLPKQHGAPWRLALPWKYGFKSAKSIVRIEFTREPPPTFWNVLAPHEYGFYSNVNPGVAHPRWSQEFETPLGTSTQIRTQLFNGYQSFVSDLYDPELLTYIS
jgi:sulfoxide reductase catalytic subunit YedY